MTQDYLQNEYRNELHTHSQFQALTLSQKLLSDAEAEEIGVSGRTLKKGKAPSAFVYMMEVE